MLFSPQTVSLPLNTTTLEGVLQVPLQATGLVIFAQANSGSRLSARSHYAAEQLLAHNLGVLRFDLLTPAESRTSDLREDVELLTQRFLAVCQWTQAQPELRAQRLGLLAIGVAGAAALETAASLKEAIGAVVTLAGRPDFLESVLAEVQAPALLLVSEGLGSHWQQRLLPVLYEPSELRVIPGAGLFFQESEALAQSLRAAAAWYTKHLSAPQPLLATAS